MLYPKMRIKLCAFAGGLVGRNLTEIQGKLQAESAATGAAIAGLSFCPHLPDAGCECRKPAPGMLLNIAKRLDIDLAEVPFIGDKLSDILAAKAAGAHPMLVLTGQGKEDVKNPCFPSNVPVYQGLAEAADQLLSAHWIRFQDPKNVAWLSNCVSHAVPGNAYQAMRFCV